MATFDEAKEAFTTNKNAVTAAAYMAAAIEYATDGGLLQSIMNGSETLLSTAADIQAYLHEQTIPLHNRAAHMGMHIVIAGGPVDGFNYIGPFKTGADAVEWARNADLDTDWWTAPLEAKEPYEIA